MDIIYSVNCIIGTLSKDAHIIYLINTHTHFMSLLIHNQKIDSVQCPLIKKYKILNCVRCIKHVFLIIAFIPRILIPFMSHFRYVQDWDKICNN